MYHTYLALIRLLHANHRFLFPFGYPTRKCEQDMTKHLCEMNSLCRFFPRDMRIVQVSMAWFVRAKTNFMRPIGHILSENARLDSILDAAIYRSFL
ncbi:hypothetical protein DSM110093_01722 [Sulfitobacter sp. DSM 110093]|nr:hypothetical protein DSM110093_01722 [Sulfitobacter sp. DSM 110093]